MEQQTFTEAADPFCLDQADAAALLTGAPWGRYAVVGDSLSAGTGDPTPGYKDQGWSDRVAAVLRSVRPELDYLNVFEFSPDLLHVPCGANDIVRRKPDFGAIERTLRQMYDLAKGTGALLTTFTLGRAYVVPVFPDWPERIAAINEIVRGLASEYDAIVVDMWDHPVNDRDNLLSADRIHFSTSGQAVMAAEVVKKLANSLGRTNEEGSYRGK
jgi:lysophospholipase L1-like esterase